MSAVVAPARGARFPDVVWDVPLLRGLDERSRRELEAAGRVRKLDEGAVVHRAGDPADALYVVTEGSCAIVAVRRGETAESVLRRVTAGEMFGEEAIVAAFVTRSFEARAERPAAIAEIPLAVLRRAVGRGGMDGAGEIVARIERVLRRAATLDLLRATSLGRALPAGDLDLLLDAARHVHVARGEYVYREGDPATDAFFVAGGILSAQTEDEGKPRIEAYLARGDIFGDEVEEVGGRTLAVVAGGPAWLVAVPQAVFAQVARKNGALAEATRRLRAPARQRPPPGIQTTANVFKDVYRMRVARSLLVIDQDSCIRCGHCAWSCAEAHDDGISRLVRRGDKVVVTAADEVARPVAPLLVPNSCQHCKNPACMIDCPTGAIGRDARGEVFILEDLCTGCGACAKACPWENIQIARRKEADNARFPDVAVKCDLCAGSSGGPACVSSCPTQAIARVDPSAAFAELRAIAPLTIFGRPAARPAESMLPRRTPAWPFVTGACAGAAGGAFALASAGPWTSGVAAGLVFVLLLGYSAAKRAPRLLGRLRPGLARPMYIAHASLGVLLAGLTIAHTGPSVPDSAAGALLLALVATIVTGAFGAIVNVVVPPRLARLERRSVLPEELSARARELDEKIFERLSGRSELVKTLFARVLRPYRRARLGGLSLAMSGRSLREEEKRLRGRVEALLEGRKSERLAGMDELIALVVERRAIRAQAIFTRVLRGWIAVHLAGASAATVLLVLHVLSLRGRP